MNSKDIKRPAENFTQIQLEGIFEIAKESMIENLERLKDRKNRISLSLKSSTDTLDLYTKDSLMDNDIHRNLLFLGTIINDKKFLNEMLSNKSKLTENLIKNSVYDKLIGDDIILKKFISQISEALDYSIKQSKIPNPELGTYSKKRSDIFAEKMTENLKKVRGEGIKTVRGIAERFNELGIQSAQGNNWSHSTISDLLKRRRKLGLEDNNGNILTK